MVLSRIERAWEITASRCYLASYVSRSLPASADGALLVAEFRYKSAIFCALGWFPPALDGERRAELKAGGPVAPVFPVR